MPNWNLSLLTADTKDVSLAEQKGNNAIFGWIRLFSLSKYHRLTRGAAEYSLWFIFALVNKGEKCFFNYKGSICSLSCWQSLSNKAGMQNIF